VIRSADRRKTQDLPPLGRVETLSGGRLRVRSLRDPEVQALLDQAHPGWQWEPMLVEIEGERVRIFAGLSLRARLVQVLGPVRASRVAQAVARHGGPVLGVDWGRRRLLQQMTGALGVWIVWRGFSRFASPPIERYAPAGTVEVLTGILVERRADRLILAHADKLWQIEAPYGELLRNGCGDEVIKRTWWVEVCPGPCADPRVAAQESLKGHLFLIRRRGHWLIWAMR
jgi:hypothetical protein